MNDEWNTPEYILDAARAAMGGIELDPASNEAAQARVQAGRYFTAEGDGLAQPWKTPALWLNPPYSRPLFGRFVAKLIAEYRSGNVKQAVMLANAATGTWAMHEFFRLGPAMCAVKGRICFIGADGAPQKSPRYDSLIFYLGERPDRFRDEFSRFGQCFEPMPFSLYGQGREAMP